MAAVPDAEFVGMSALPFGSLFEKFERRLTPEASEIEDDNILPRSLPYIGFFRHAPHQALHCQLDRLLQRRRYSAMAKGPFSDGTNDPEKPIMLSPVLPRTSPYVGFKRHAPPSPMLHFGAIGTPDFSPLSCAMEPLPTTLEENEEFEMPSSLIPLDLDVSLTPVAEPTTRECNAPGFLPQEVWEVILWSAIDVCDILTIASIAPGFLEAVKSPDVWCGRPVRISPSLVRGLAPQLCKWLTVWRRTSKLVLPRSSQLLAEVQRLDPCVPIEVMWRFDQNLKGNGVEVLNHGLAVRRIDDEELVVLGDAPLPKGRTPYLEVRLDERKEAAACSEDELNDFGLGVTACDPEEISELGAVADEVPRSWVVDFTQSSVVLSVNNNEAAKGYSISAYDLHKGDRIGLRVLPNAVEVYLNGVLCETLRPPPAECVPMGIDLFPVLDLYGRTVQISRTAAEEPLPP
jgi:hypothetical protein